AYTGADGAEHAAQKSKLNAAFAYGGPSLLVRTIETLTNIRIDHYLQIDFVGFQAMTDALGGVTVCVKELPAELKARGLDNLNDRYSGWHGQVGDNTLDGGQALAFVRQRYGLPEGDIDRIRRQQQFLGVIFREVASAGTLLNPGRLLDVVGAATSALTLDQNTSLTDLRGLAVRMQGISSGGVAFKTVPATPSTVGQQSVLLAKDDELAVLLDELGGSRPNGAVGLGRVPTAAPVVSAAAPVVSAVSSLAGSSTVTGGALSGGALSGGALSAEAVSGSPSGGLTLAQAGPPTPSEAAGCTY
ncbi:LCP family protein, partial [Frankia sp. EI5c]|uniref:LCP family protein n=1 Tax=Frankia sp. EI5c TaxID=683316 RepID=UPI001F5B4693